MSDALNMGFIRVGAAVPKVHIASPMANAEEMIRIAEQAAKEKVAVLVFPELCLTGYTCADLFHQQLLLSNTRTALEYLLIKTQIVAANMLIVIGLPIEADNQLFNCAAILHNGKILGIVPKVFIPNYNEFYEKRWFSPARNRLSNSITLCGQVVPFNENLLFKDNKAHLCLGAEICEDLWMPVPPSSRHALHGANLLVNLSASNELVGKTKYREDLIRLQSARCFAGYVYASAGPSESTTDVVFGGQMMIAENGSILEQNRFHDGILIYADVDLDKMMNERRKSNSFMDESHTDDYRVIPFILDEAGIGPRIKREIDPYPFVPSKKEERDLRCREIFMIQQTGLSQRLLKTGIRKAVIGISGGLDSTLALLVCREAFAQLEYPLNEIYGITMPGFGTTGRTLTNARNLMQELGVRYQEIAISDACLKHFEDIGHDPAIKDVTYENVQARERTQILMDIANKQDGLVIGTGDLSELALGWCTYNGDHMSHYGVNAGVPKTLVKYLVSWYADTTDNPKIHRILRDILDTPISPELLPPDITGKIEQKTEELIGSYDLHDFFLYNMMRWGFSPAKVYYLACSAFSGEFTNQEILKWLKVFYRRFFSQQFKRSCLPDGPKVGSICLSPRGDWRMPSDANAQMWLNELDTLN
ncbi:NAD(+) synthase [Dehalobacter sp. DCM]|uniref:NAD(+) synthase n=1 Tax=Dehalobacter sp. DCM TaxID=2907827 RepID=UPI0030815FBB|nr:NAD(+) synthase [Dehalobacter sp. DCM]